MSDVLITLPRLAGPRRAARDLCEAIEPGDTVLIDFRELRSAPPSFIEELMFYATCPPANTNKVTLRNLSYDVVEMVEDWHSRGGKDVGPNIYYEHVIGF